MGNPARELHELYGAWRSTVAASSNGTLALQQIVNPTTADGAGQVLRAARYLVRISDLLSEMERQGAHVGLYRRQFPRWVLPVVGYSGWQNQIGAETVMPEADFDSLEGFANYLDGKVAVFNTGGEANIRQILRSARDLLEQDDSLDDGLKMYIHRLLSEIERALDDAAVGASYDFAAGVEQLYVAVRAAAGASTKASGLWRDLGVQFTAGLLSSGVLQGGTAILAAITSGG
ncbi:hypothetical protein JNB62_13090 [Microbacterium jejuense]|uniref:Uncharacterized protein n=1 Tax=Microbacterium jejuense TaxID=1263637 RepID=A0ABS7HPI3_9MICO|nr:hypothetical protein [Microbacterium jejuense]MBW9094625.1 hypothetical protein [Microbacterium jejuense]